MALPTSIEIQTTFSLYPSPSKFKLVNLTPLVSEGITLSDVKGNYKIVNPLGVTVYENTSLVSPDLYSFSITGITRTSQTATATTSGAHGLTSGDTVLIDGAVETQYNGTFEVTVLSTTTFTYTVSGSPSTPATGTILGLKMSLNSVSIPSASGTTFPISGAYTVTLTTIVAGAVQADTYIKDFDYTYAYVRPMASLTTSVDCFKAIYINTDATTYAVNGVQPTMVFQHTIAYPIEANRSNEVYATQIVELRYPKVYNGVYQNKIQTTLTYEFSDGLVVTDLVVGLENFEVACDVNLCNITCALNDLNTSYQQAAATDLTLARTLYDKLNRALQLRDLYLQNQACGNNTEASNYLTEIYNVTGSSASCSCGSGGQIIPYEGIVTGTIYLYDSQTPFNVGIYIDYDNQLYRVLESTLAGENPDNTPSKFQNVSISKGYVDTAVSDAITTSSDYTDSVALTLLPKFDVSNNNNDVGNIYSGNLNGETGTILLTGVIASNSSETFSIGNNLCTPNSRITDLGLLGVNDLNICGYVPTGNAFFVTVRNNTGANVSGFRLTFRINN